MKLNPMNILFGNDRNKKPPVLLAVTPPRTGERTLLGVENLLQSIAVPEPFSLEIVGHMDGVDPYGPLPATRRPSRANSRPTTPRPASRRCPRRRTPCAWETLASRRGP